MGILNKKERIMDTIITVEGRRQFGRGNFRPEFASFTDGQAFYETDAISGSTDARDRILFEAVSLPADKIFLEYDDSGRLLGSPDVKINIAGNSGIFLRDDNGNYNLANNSNFTTLAETMVTGAIDNLNRHQLLGSYKPNDVNDFSFDLTEENIDFVIDNITPFGNLPNKNSKEIDAMQPFLYDKRLNHLPQFQFLPPVRSSDNKLVSLYDDLNDRSIITFQDLINDIGELPLENKNTESEKDLLSQFGNLEDSFVNAAKQNTNPNIGYPRESVKFVDTTLSNNIFAQCFEIRSENNENYLEKLSVIDFGTFRDNSDKNRPDKHVFFVGKVKDGVGNMPTFINLFTLVFD